MRQLKSKKAGDEMERVELSHRHTHTARAGASQRGVTIKDRDHNNSKLIKKMYLKTTILSCEGIKTISDYLDNFVFFIPTIFFLLA